MGFRDIHSHFVYGVDDGAKTREDMEAMLDAAHADGIAALVSTPHMTPGLHDFDTDLYERHLVAAQAYCAAQGYEMELYRGAEILYTPMLVNYVSTHHLPTLADTNTVLVEFVPDIALSEMEEALDMLERNGYSVIMAHVERYACLFRSKALNRIREDFRVKCQMNCRTVSAGIGLWRGHRIQAWLKEGLIDCVASDAHNTTTRSFGMTQAYRVLTEKVGRKAAASMTGIMPERMPC